MRFHVGHIMLAAAATCSPSCSTGYTCVAPNICRQGVQITLNGVVYLNNSLIQIDKVKETRYSSSDDVLICSTDLRPCCASHNTDGKWIFPNGTEIATSHTSGHGFYYIQRNDGTLRLYRRTGVDGPTGSYCCLVRDKTGNFIKQCVELGKLNYNIHRLGLSHYIVIIIL